MNEPEFPPEEQELPSDEHVEAEVQIDELMQVTYRPVQSHYWMKQ